MLRNPALALCGALLLCASTAQAATISFNDSWIGVPVPAAPAPLATLSLFDPSLGTLTKVTLELDADTFAGSIAWDNEAPVVTDVTLGIGAEVTTTGLAGLSVVSIPLQLGGTLGIASDNDAAPDFVGTDAFSVAGGIGNDVQSNSLVAGFGAYVGIGTFDTTVSSSVANFLATTGGFGPIQQTPGQTSGTVTVTYEYTAVPEPGTALLIGLSLLGLAVRARR